MIYQFEHEEIKRCRECPCRFIIDHACSPDWCSLQGCAVTVDDTPEENDCPLVAISKTETTSCEWCEIASACEYEVTFFRDDDRWATERSLMPKFCPNCGRKLD